MNVLLDMSRAGHTSGEFVVKVQVPLHGPGELMVYDEEKDVHYLMDPRSPLAATLSKAIANQEIQYGKGYFRSVIRKIYLHYFLPLKLLF